MFILATVGFGAILLRESIARAAAPKGHGRAHEEGEIVSSAFVPGTEWVVKVYKSRRQYEVQLIYMGEFKLRKTGFGTPEAARGWGINYAKQHSGG